MRKIRLVLGACGALGALGALTAGACVLSAGCDKKSEATTSKPAAAPAAPEPPGADGSYVLKTETVGDCKVGATCTVALRLEPQSDFHINDEYPYKYTAGDVSGVEFQGTDGGGKNVFSKAAGNFKKDSPKAATLTVTLKPTAKGKVDVSGVYKLSVCSDQTCKLDNPTVAFAVDVK